MISSEVERTLVKSPPELWAELSDPAALARHLGEFGEIRITRIDPEQAVEWEAEDASGKVQIKPSAWGTRVTLTVTRQVPEPGAPPSWKPPAQSEEPVEAEPETAADARHQPAAYIEPDPVPSVQAEQEPAAQTEAGPWLVHLAEEPPDAPAATAMAVEPGTEAEVEPAIAPAIGPAVEPGTEAEVEPAIEPAVGPIADPGPELLPRRGFFSRLFGRRRRTAASELDPPETGASAASPSEPSEPSEPSVAITALEPQPAEPGETTATSESQFGSPVTAAGAQWQPHPETAAPGGAQRQPAEAPTTDAAVEQPQPAPADAVGEQVDEPAASADAAPQDASEGLEAAEQAAAKETAVALTAVLDRLGAAHHRPFSRG